LTAFHLLRRQGIKIAVHLIFGLPGEEWTDITTTVRLVAGLRPEGLKLHNLHIPLGTAMYAEYLQGELTVPRHERYLQWVIRTLELFAPETIIMRLTCDTPAGRLAAPRGFLSKNNFYEAVKKEMQRQNTWQGRLWSATS
jgi:radical SAM superfamily enzyme